ncbi:MAG: hypothetical protein ACUVWX_11895, partial [Kiritimatiellia bacterium]
LWVPWRPFDCKARPCVEPHFRNLVLRTPQANASPGDTLLAMAITTPLRTLTYLQPPGHMHRWFRTTNYLERLFRNVCSRTKPMTPFDQPCHLERLVIGTIMDG